MGNISLLGECCRKPELEDGVVRSKNWVTGLTGGFTLNLPLWRRGGLIVLQVVPSGWFVFQFAPGGWIVLQVDPGGWTVTLFLLTT